MVKTPKMRHSKSQRDPVTIDLEPGAVSRIDDEPITSVPDDGAATEAVSDAPRSVKDDDLDSAEQQVRAEEADFEPWEKDGTVEAAAVDKPTAESEPAEDPRPAYATAAAASASAGHKTNFDYGFDAGSPPNGDQTRENPPRTSGGERTAQAQPKRGINGIAAGIIGGVIALAGAGGLQFAGLLGAPGSGVSLDSVNGEIASLNSEIAALKQGSGTDDGAARVDGLSAALDQVKSDVSALKSAVESGGAGGDSGLAALSDKVAQIETAVAALGQGGNTASVDLGPLNEKLAGLDALVKSTGETVTAQEGRLTALEQSVSQLSGKVEAQASQPKIALAIAASALKAALDRGAPFSAELETFAAIAPDSAEIAALRPYAEKGVPTRAEIAEGADAAATAMVAAATPATADASLFQQLIASAESLVKVRPIGAVEGAGAPETVARMEVAVNQGDYIKALAEYDTLPEAAKAAGADFAGKLKARIEVEKQVDALIAGAMKA